MIAIQLSSPSSEKRTAQKETAVKLGARAYRDGANNQFVVHKDFKDFPISPFARRFELKQIPEQWIDIT